MKEKGLRYIFWFSALSLLVIMLIASSTAGISCDEILHYNNSVNVYNYFATHGADKSVFTDHPELNLKYYGQSYDNFVTFVTKWLHIDNIYGFRNIMSAIAGWLAILVTALFAIWLRDEMTGIIVLFLFAVSPAFFGHSLNNLKDIPFALGYIAGIFFTFRFLAKTGKVTLGNSILLTLSFAFCISIRAGGMLLICYLFLFFASYYFFKYVNTGRINAREVVRKLAWISVMCLIAFLLSSVLWPFALQDPFRNIIESYKIMAHYPATFRQIFEGKVEWSDFMPWYYLPKTMAITIPLVVLAGLVLFSAFIRKILPGSKNLLYGFLVFTVVFPVVFVIIEKSNLYSSWRQFLFVYPGIILLAATGFAILFESFSKKYLKWIAAALIILLSIHPLRFMIKNHPYEYIYYNELTGGLKGAYGNYETDYYFVSHAEASKWLINYLEEKRNNKPVKIEAGYSIGWFFRKHPEMETSSFRYEERSMTNWDYAIAANRYISPFMLKRGIWPPKNSIHVIYADGVPVCAVLERKTKDDLKGYEALQEGKNKDAIEYFRKAIQSDNDDEMIFYNFAAALYNDGQFQAADSALKKGLEINPDFELIYMYKGNIAAARGNTDEAVTSYEKVISINRKYYEAYVALARLIGQKDVMKARSLLRTCLRMNPGYREAIVALGDTYKISDPEIAKKYYNQANNISN